MGVVRLAVLIVVLLATFVACKKPKPGDACERGKASCLDPKTELQCQSGKFIAAPCRGPKGCAVASDMQTCDFSANGAGDTCSTEDDDIALCTSDKKSRVVCKTGQYVIEACKGPKGCFEEGSDKVHCDATLADEGDECLSAQEDSGGLYVCSVDQKKSLRCDDGKFVVDEICRGPGGCEATSGLDLSCDRGDQSLGDPCGSEGGYECSGDKKSLMVCKGRRWSVERACKGPCESTEKTADCTD